MQAQQRRRTSESRRTVRGGHPWVLLLEACAALFDGTRGRVLTIIARNRDDLLS